MTNQNTAQNVSTISADIVHDTVIGITERQGVFQKKHEAVVKAAGKRSNSFLDIVAFVIVQFNTLHEDDKKTCKKNIRAIKDALIENKVWSERKVKAYFAFVGKYRSVQFELPDGKGKTNAPQADQTLILQCLGSLGITSYAKMDKFGKEEKEPKKLSPIAQELVEMLRDLAIDQAEISEEFGGLVTEENKVEATTMIEEALTKWAHFLEKETK